MICTALIIGYVLVIALRREIVLKQQVKLEKDYTLSQSFGVDDAALYALAFECDRTLPGKQLDDVLTSDFPVEFAIRTNSGDAILDNNRHPGYNRKGNRASHVLCWLHGNPGTSYHLDARLTRSLPELSSANPMIVVRMTNPAYTDKVVAEIVLTIIGVILLFLGVLCLVILRQVM